MVLRCFIGAGSLAAAKGDKTLAQLAGRYSVHANQISSWNKQLLDTAPELFEDGRRKRKEDRETNQNELYEQIGRLKMEVDWLKKKLTASARHKCELIDPRHETLSVRRQCELLDLNRSTYYFQPAGDSPRNLELMRRIDELHLEWPLLGSRMIGKNLGIGRRRARRLMRNMGIETIYPKPRTTFRNKQHEVYPYSLRDLEIVRCDQVWSTDITYVPLAQGYMYLTAVIDWHSRYVLSWRLSNTLDGGFCIKALEEALSGGRKPSIFNTDQGCQYTSVAFTSKLKDQGIRISMDGRGRALDNVFIERFWRSVKYEDIYLRGYESPWELERGLERYFDFYCQRRPGWRFGPYLSHAENTVMFGASRIGSMRAVVIVVVLAVASTPLSAAEGAAPKAKSGSSLYPQQLVDRARANIAEYEWAGEMRKSIIQRAEPWVKLSDDALWRMMFGNTISRSWMVWSNGHCPACMESVPMYQWTMRPMHEPWKVRCPHCDEAFPKNDFGKFYESGLNQSGVFDPALADRRLLFNTEHPDQRDPLRAFGVDDGEGFVDGDKRWRFIGAYLVYGHWKAGVLTGIRNLAAAYVVTADPIYAHKAGILLDRLADLYPTFDYKAQGYCYEKKISAGYLSVWHDSCEETRQLALAYDQVFEALREDEALVAFLSKKAARHGLDNPKTSFAQVQANIENRILRDALANPAKIHSNYPRAEICKAVIKTVLAWPENRDEVYKMIDGFVANSTGVDGLTGEKGLANYSAFTIQSLALFFGEYDRADPTFLAELLKRHPRLHQTYRFHIDTWCMQEYYPLSGDSGWYAKRIDEYQGVRFRRPRGEAGYSHHDASLAPSMFTFMWRLYELTGDAAFVQVLHHANAGGGEGLPYDLFAADPEAFQRQVAEVIAREGPALKLGNVNKTAWRIAILRSGRRGEGRALWLDYDSGGGHAHLDGMNLGLFAKGLDLMPDFGYPPVQFGGWGSAKATWYRATAAHNTVVVDGKWHAQASGQTTLWADGERFSAIRASCPAMIGGAKFERTVALVDVSDADSYVVDIFRVVGGTDHAKFMQSHFGTLSATGLSLAPGGDYGHGVQMRNFRTDPSPRPGWSVVWNVEDRYKILPEGTPVHLRYTDFTAGAAASTAEGWVTTGQYDTTDEAWIPRIMVRRAAKEAPLASTFVSVIEPYGETPSLTSIRRLAVTTRDGRAFGDSTVALEMTLADGRSDLFLAADVDIPPPLESERPLTQAEWGLQLNGQMCFVRKSANGAVERIVVCAAESVKVGELVVTLRGAPECVELRLDGTKATLAAGREEDVVSVVRGGEELWGN